MGKQNRTLRNRGNMGQGHFPDSLSELHTLRNSPRLAQWPQDLAFYVSLTKEMFPGAPDQWRDRQRFVSILCEMLYTDGRSLDALMYIAEMAAQDPNYEGNGINALAGMYCRLLRHGPSGHAHLLDTFQRLARTPALAVNAKQCAKLVSNQA
jgi:hypothetical protein